jgi:uncharacterized protein (TIRG00374 family)
LNNLKLLKFFISILLLTLLLCQLNFEKIKLLLITLNVTTVSWMLILLYTLIFFQGIRWWLIGKKLGINWSIRLAIKLTYVGIFFSQLLPSSMGGDAVRAWKLKRLGVSISKAATSVFIDRISALIAIFIIFCLGLPLLYEILYKLIDGLHTKAFYFSLMIFILLIATLVLAYCRLELIRQNHYVGAIIRCLNEAASFYLSPSTLLITTVISLVSQVISGFIVWMLAISFGAKFGFLEFSLVWPIILILTMLPISIAGWGVREGALVVAFKVLGNPPEVALASSVAYGILMLFVGVPGGIIYFLSLVDSRKKIQLEQ